MSYSFRPRNGFSPPDPTFRPAVKHHLPQNTTFQTKTKHFLSKILHFFRKHDIFSSPPTPTHTEKKTKKNQKTATKTTNQTLLPTIGLAGMCWACLLVEGTRLGIVSTENNCFDFFLDLVVSIRGAARKGPATARRLLRSCT
mgnify:CR=1 FL=1